MKTSRFVCYFVSLMYACCLSAKEQPVMKTTTPEAARCFLEATAYAANQQYQTAVELFDAAISIDPAIALFWAGRAEAALEMGDYQKALDDYTQAIDMEEKTPTLGGIGGVCVQQSRFVALSGSASDDGWLQFMRAMTHVRLGHKEEAVSDLIKSARLGNNHAMSALWAKDIAW
jgi:tetratricopeptide (TPR) repeat protein